MTEPAEEVHDNHPGDWHVAIHEAGHAVVAVALESTFDFVTIERTQGDHGFVFSAHDPEDWAAFGTITAPGDQAALYMDRAIGEDLVVREARILRKVCILVAGGQAAQNAGMVPVGLDGDQEHAEELLGNLSEDEEVRVAAMAYATARARSILRDQWPTIEAVAERLVERRRLDRFELLDLLPMPPCG